LGYDRSYPTFTRHLRGRGLRPHSEPCHPAKDRALAVIEHPPGDETHCDWVELPDPPAYWGWGGKACTARSAQSGRGRPDCRRSTATSCRRTKISTSLTASLRVSSTSQPNTRTMNR
jgi:hypothetical protein